MSSNYTSNPGGLMIEGAVNLEESETLLVHPSHLEDPEGNNCSFSSSTSTTFCRTPSLSKNLDGDRASAEKNEKLKYSAPSIASIDPDCQRTNVPPGWECSYPAGLVGNVFNPLDTPKPRSNAAIASGTWHRLKTDLWMWKWEALACLTSISAMALLLVGAIQYQSSKLANWPYPVTVNSAVSWCGTISKTCMLFSVAGCINQLKWRWFRSKKPLAAMDSFDEASRGPWGALNLLLRIREIHLVSLGAIITLFTLIMDPVVQSLVAVKEVPYVSDDARITYLQNYTFTPADGEPGSTVDNPLRQAMIQGLSLSSPALEYSCPRSGICTWRTVSLALCHECQNISQLVDFSNITTAGTFSLPNGNSVEFRNTSSPANPAWVLQSSANYHNPSNAFGPSNSIEDISVVTRTKAHACSVFFCVNAYSTEVSYGLFSENITASWDSHYSYSFGDENFELPPNNFSSAFNRGTSYSAGGLAWQTIADGFNSLFIGQYPPPYNEYDSITSISAFTAMEALNVQNRSASELENFFSVIAHITDSVSFALRGSASSELYTGKSSVMQTILSVQWKWLGIPMVFPVFTLALLIATAVTSAKDKVPIWKSSQSPLLLHGLSEELQEKHAAANTLSEIEADAKNIHVELVDTGVGWRLV